MSDDEPNNETGILQVEHGALSLTSVVDNRILSQMVGEILVLTRQEQAAVQAAMWRIGAYEFCEPDYRQILIWAKALALEPGEVIRRLLDKGTVTVIPQIALPRDSDRRAVLFDIIDRAEERGMTTPQAAARFIAEQRPDARRYTKALWGFWLSTGVVNDEGPHDWHAIYEALCPSWKTTIRDGIITEVDWNLDSLPLDTFEWFPGMRISRLRIGSAADLPSKLQHLDCSSLGLMELEVSGISSLEYLKCSCNQLSKLQLYKLPSLKDVYCDGNQLTDLDLSGVTHLRDLNCAANQLAGLDLSCLPALTALCCEENRLAHLNLVFVRELRELCCAENRLTKLDLSAVPWLEFLDCRANPLAELDITHHNFLYARSHLCYDETATVLFCNGKPLDVSKTQHSFASSDPNCRSYWAYLRDARIESNSRSGVPT